MKKAFEVGESVVFYHGQKYNGTIVYINANGLMDIECLNPFTKRTEIYAIHPKQCRRIKKKEPLEFVGYGRKHPGNLWGINSVKIDSDTHKIYARKLK